jgi:hypothetical protein
MMLKDNDFQQWVEWLNISNVTVLLSTLWGLRSNSVGDARLLPYLEKRLGDKQIGLMGVPFIYGSVCYAAGYALYAMRERLNIADVVIVEGVFDPIKPKEINRLAREAGIFRTDYSDFHMGMIGLLHALVDAELIPLYTLKLTPKLGGNDAKSSD